MEHKVPQTQYFKGLWHLYVYSCVKDEILCALQSFYSLFRFIWIKRITFRGFVINSNIAGPFRTACGEEPGSVVQFTLRSRRRKDAQAPFTGASLPSKKMQPRFGTAQLHFLLRN